MVPLFGFVVAGRLIPRIGAGRVIAIGASVFAAGSAWWAFAAGLQPDYVSEMLGGMILTGIGVGLTLPTFMAAGTSSLPPTSFATGSAVINMLRQVGLALGVAVFIAVLGTPGSPVEVINAYRRSSLVIAALSLAAAVAGVVMLRARAAGAPAVVATASGAAAPVATQAPSPGEAAPTPAA